MKPRLITRWGLAAGAAAKFAENYRKELVQAEMTAQARERATATTTEAERAAWFPEREARVGATYRQVLAELVALGPTPSPADVERVWSIGGWMRLHCNGCGESVEAVVEVGEEPDYESATASLCNDCLTEAVAVMRGEVESPQPSPQPPPPPPAPPAPSEALKEALERIQARCVAARETSLEYGLGEDEHRAAAARVMAYEAAMSDIRVAMAPARRGGGAR